MVGQTNEQALEVAIEQALTGSCIEAIKAGYSVSEAPAGYGVANNGYKLGLPTDFNEQYALDEKFFWSFLENTQQEELEKFKKHNVSDWERKILERFDRLNRKDGVLRLLKKGLDIDDAHCENLWTDGFDHAL